MAFLRVNNGHAFINPEAVTVIEVQPSDGGGHYRVVAHTVDGGAATLVKDGLTNVNEALDEAKHWAGEIDQQLDEVD